MEELERMVDDVPLETQKLVDVHPAAIAFGCTAGSFLGGPGYDRQILDIMNRHAPGVPCTTTTSSVLAALKAMNFCRIILYTPYPEWLTLRQVDLFTKAGFEVIRYAFLGMEDMMNEVAPGEIYEAVKRLDDPRADGVFISCTDFPSTVVLPSLETRLGKPVINSNVSTLWMLLRSAGLGYRSGHCRLLSTV
jgi:maleate isomerase